ncbi:His-Xaa-Ser system radical SAM maturase HxsB [Bradyrhizobium sp. CCGB12]|uniref:His-Xaa-Ser system radical SAM maturase HxsB n=1 Tax=Bradyrhizobium sp. CCGB12 TaxID=2949632 RepID=UPI0020B238BA|nr:His-Xaa-Ser system radical SAM maturase HxsB [Bradyrhizobium sp. CCGB12]MCP3393386.1 His-Xaa-Ser system radical SAM maturase HxsB [Bradyrhizobium sp. CCGB12]
MSRFFLPGDFHGSNAPLQLLPLRFERTSAQQYLVSNIVGDFIRLDADEFQRLIDLRLNPGDGLYERAYSAHLVSREGQSAQHQILAMRLRTRMSFLRQPSALHMFVVTLRCEHSCPYCQVSRQSTDRSRFDMSEETAQRSLSIALQSPASRIKIEFQGGEPLLNFALIQKVVEAAKREAPTKGKEVDFVIASNLALLTDDILSFCRTNHVSLSTSLDGPPDLHNRNRPRPGGNSHELAVQGIKKAQATLGRDRVSALMTTTRQSLARVEEIIDEYAAHGLDGVFLRPLSPYGFAIKTKQFQKYDPAEWMTFYRRGLRYILDLNRRGHEFYEFYTLLLLRRILTDQPIGYVDLRSPAGIGLGALVYNYDGRVFASDEGRMLAEMGDRTFELGHVANSDYRSLILSDKLVSNIASSLSQCAPECHDCVYESHCGADPVYHHAIHADPLGIKPLSGFCQRQKGVISTILDLLDDSPEDAVVLRSWSMM